MGSDVLLEHVLGDKTDDETEDGITDAHDEFYRSWWDRLRAFEGAAELLRECAKRGYEVVLASSAQEEELDNLRRVLDADDVVTAATSSAKADKSKPAPDILEAALDRSGLKAEDTVFVGDSVWTSRRRASSTSPASA